MTCGGCGGSTTLKMKPAAKPTLNGFGPGSQMLAIMPSYAKLYAWLSLENCGCEEYAAMMDYWGINGCRAKRAEIVQHLVSKAPAFLQRFNMTYDRATKLLEESIKLSKAAMPKSCSCGRMMKPHEGPFCFWCENKKRLVKR